MKTWLKEKFELLPMVGGLGKCEWIDGFNALCELSSILFFSFIPLLIAFVIAYLKSHNTSFWSCFNDNVQNGELFLYVTSLLAPVFYIVMKKRNDEDVFPSKAGHVLVYFSIIIIACLPGKGGTLSCNKTSSSAISTGKRSRRVDSICPNLINIGPRSSSASRIRWPRGPRLRRIQFHGARNSK